MASDLRPAALFFRNTLVNDDVDASVLAYVRKIAPVHFTVRHNADEDDPNPHWHHLMYTKKGAQTFRAELIKAVPGIRKKYSVKVVGSTIEDHEAIERYMCKGECDGDRVTIVSAQSAVYHAPGAFTQAWAQEQNKRFYQVQRAFVKKKKDQKVPLLDKIVQLCQERSARAVAEVAQVMVEVYTDEGRDMNVYAMKGKLRTILCRLNGKTAQRSVVAELCEGLVDPPNIFLPISTDESDPLESI